MSDITEKLRLIANGFEREKVTNAQAKSAIPAIRAAAAELAERDAEIERLRVASKSAFADRAARVGAACQAALRALDTYNSMYRHHMTVQLISARANLRDVLANVDNEGV